jgi:hypothetical protein
LYFALVSGYLVTAYFLGSRLTRLQVSVVNVLFCLWTAGILGGYINTVSDTIQLETAIREIGVSPVAGKVSDSTFASYSFAIVQLFGVFASLVFMWSVRHPRK